VVTNLIFSYSGKDFAPLVPILWSIHSRGVGREAVSEDQGKNVVQYLSLLPIHFYQHRRAKQAAAVAGADPMVHDGQLQEDSFTD